MVLLLPKFVELANLKLRILYYTVQFVFVSLVIAKFVLTEQWSNTWSLDRHMAGEIWINPMDQARLREVWLEQSSSLFCADPGRVDYQWDADGHYKYVNHSCYPPCFDGEPDPSGGCVHVGDIHAQESQSQLFFATQFSEHGPQEGAPRMAFVPLETASGLSFTYEYAMPRPSLWGAKFSEWGVHEKPHMILASSSSNVLTVIQGADRSVARVVRPGPSPIQFDISEVLELAGRGAFLDSVNEAAGVNRHPSATLNGPIGRITGLHIDLHVDCRQHLEARLPIDEHWSGNAWEGNVCYVRVEQSPTKQWSSSEQRGVTGLSGEPSVRRFQHGIRVAFVFGGRFSFFDMEFLILQITSSIVFLFFPKKIIFFFACNMLGHLSKIYRDALIEDFSLAREVARITARILSTSVSFIELEEEPDNLDPDLGTPEPFISRETLDEQMREVLAKRNSVLDENELRSLIDFCYDSLLGINSMSHKSTFQSFRRDVGELRDITSSQQSAIFAGRSGAGIDSGSAVDIDVFSMCCASSPSMNFDNFVGLFDSNRRMHVLERTFTPQYLVKLGTLSQGNSPDFREPDPELPGTKAAALRMRKTKHSDSDLIERMDSLERLFAEKGAEALGRIEALSRDVYSRLDEMQWSYRDCFRQVVGEVASDKSSSLSACKPSDKSGAPCAGGRPEALGGPASAMAEHPAEVSPRRESEAQLREVPSAADVNPAVLEDALSQLDSAPPAAGAAEEHGLSALTLRVDSLERVAAEAALAIRGLGGGDRRFSALERRVSELEDTARRAPPARSADDPVASCDSAFESDTGGRNSGRSSARSSVDSDCSGSVAHRSRQHGTPFWAAKIFWSGAASPTGKLPRSYSRNRSSPGQSS